MKRAPHLLAASGSLVVLAVTFLPWYRVGAGHLPRTAWQENPVVLVLLLAVTLAGAALAAAGARGVPVRRRAVISVFGLTLIATLVVVFSLFIDRPGGNAATGIAYGGYPALLGINLVKASAIATLVQARRARGAALVTRRAADRQEAPRLRSEKSRALLSRTESGGSPGSRTISTRRYLGSRG